MVKRNAITDFVYSLQKKNEPLSKTLTNLLKNKAQCNNFLSVILSNPRDNKPAYRLFFNSFKTKSQYRKWMNTYHKKYTQYIHRYCQQATCIEDLIRRMPNFTPWALEERFSEIKIGSVPSVFHSESQLLSFVSSIKKSTAVRNLNRIKKLECSQGDFEKAFPKAKKINWFNLKQRFNFLKDLINQKCGKPFKLSVSEQQFKITFLCNPFSAKMVFLIESPDNEKFILKINQYNLSNTHNDRTRKEHENMAIRADSTYSDALLEFYLKLNDCPHAPSILYYNFRHEVALYKADTGIPFHSQTNKNKFMDFYSFNTKVVSDCLRLGVYINDINAGNFILSATDNQVKIIDIGHASFANPLTPGIPGLTFTLGNLCGQDYISVNGVLDIEDI